MKVSNQGFNETIKTFEMFASDFALMLEFHPSAATHPNWFQYPVVLQSGDKQLVLLERVIINEELVFTYVFDYEIEKHLKNFFLLKPIKVSEFIHQCQYLDIPLRVIHKDTSDALQSTTFKVFSNAKLDEYHKTNRIVPILN